MSADPATAENADARRARLGRAAQLSYGVLVAALGALCLETGKLSSVFQPVPPWMPLRGALAYASGSILVAGGLALLAKRTARLAALALTLNFLVLWLLLCNVPSTLAKPTVIGRWEGCGLVMSVAAGAWIVLARATPPVGRAARLVGQSGVALARRVYGLGVPLVGLAHFIDAADAVTYVPAWLPFRIGWVYLTGAGHVLAGLAIVFGVLAELAALLEAAQITAFIVLTHIPSVIRAPTDRMEIGMLVYAAAIAASSWLLVAWSRPRRARGVAREPT